MIDKVVDKNHDLNVTQRKILIEIENNPRITQPQLAAKLVLGKTIIQNNIAILKKEGYIERIGSNKSGHWNIIDNF